MIFIPHLKYTYIPVPIPEKFEDFFEKKLEESHLAGVRPGNEERLLRQSKSKTRYAFLYIHGFGACRAEGEEVMDRISKKYRANLYYLRLPGHGTTPMDHASHSFQEYLQTAEESLMMMHLLGERIIVFGTSMGGLITTYLASRHPDRISGIVLTSPFYDFVNKFGKMAAYPGMIHVMNLVMGPVRRAGSESDPPPNHRLPGYDNYWYPEQYYGALRPLARLRKFAAKPSIYERISTPAMLLYYYRDQKNQDNSAEVKTMLEFFSRFGKISRHHPQSRAINIPHADHVMMSSYVRSDYDLVEYEVSRFLDDLMEVSFSKRKSSLSRKVKSGSR